MSMNALYQTAISFTSQNMGAAKYNRINRIVITAEILVILVGNILGGVVLLFGEQLLSLYSKNTVVIAAGMVRLKIIVGTYALCGMMDVMVGILRGLGYSVVPMIVSLIGACALRIVWIATFFRMERFHTIEMIYYTYPVSWSITFCAHLMCFIIIRRKLGKKWRCESES